MKVLVVADVLGEENNGTTIACMNLVRYLKSQGDDVRILCADKDKKGLENYYVVPNLNLGFIINKIVEKNNVSLAKPDKKIILEALEGVDIVHIMMPFALGKATVKLARKKGLPITAGFHCQAENFTAHLKMMNFAFANKLTYKNFYKKLYRHVDAIHYPTIFIKNYFENVIHRKTNGYVISNGVNDQYRPLKVDRKEEYSKHFNILFIGRYSREKSHHLLIKAVNLSKYKNNIQLIFAGQGPYENKYRKMASKYHIIPPIMKFYSRKELTEVINSCDLYVHPAEIEIEAISCLEAISCGLVPVISNSNRCATKAFALSELNLFDYDSSEDLAHKIDYWIEHPQEKEECSKKYLGYTREFNQSNCMSQMREMLLTYTKKECYTSQTKYYYRDEIHDDFANNGIIAKHNKKGFKYYHNGFFFNIAAFILYYIIAKPLVGLLNKLVYHQKIINKRVLKPYQRNGYFIYANHTTSMGDAFTPNILTKKKNHILVSEETTSIPGLKNIVMMMGAIPVPYYPENQKTYFEALKKYAVNKKRSITIYPEAHIWPSYTKIRPYKSSSFRYPVDFNLPVFTITNTYRKRKHSKKPRLVSIVDGPFFPDYSLERKDAIQQLRDDVYQNMVKHSLEEEQIETIRYIKVDK